MIQKRQKMFCLFPVIPFTRQTKYGFYLLRSIIQSAQVASLKFVPPDELLITGSANKTVGMLLGNEDGSYGCSHTMNNPGTKRRHLFGHLTGVHLLGNFSGIH